MLRVDVHDPAVPLAAYIDLKSPYAFIAIRPIRAMARSLGLTVDWRPFTLDIPSYLGSARLDSSGKVAESKRTPQQWSGVRYAYRDARRYAQLTGLALRGTEKIWDSSLAGIAMLWAKRQSPAHLDALLDACYPPFWQRDLDIEDIGVLTGKLESVGVDTRGFDAWAQGEGRALHDAINTAAFDAGVFGVPTFAVAGELWFGREHLPRVEWLLRGRVGPAPDVANRNFGPEPPAVPRATGAPLDVIVDIRHPHAALALEPTLALIESAGLAARFLPIIAQTLHPPRDALASDDRGARHKSLRGHALAREIEVYAQAQGLTLRDPYRDGDPSAAHSAILWVQDAAPDRTAALLRALFAAYWTGDVAADSVDAVAAAIEGIRLDADIWREWHTRHGPARLASTRQALLADGVNGTPAFRFADEVYLGRQHLPMIAWIAAEKVGPPPI